MMYAPVQTRMVTRLRSVQWMWKGCSIAAVRLAMMSGRPPPRDWASSSAAAMMTRTKRTGWKIKGGIGVKEIRRSPAINAGSLKNRSHKAEKVRFGSRASKNRVQPAASKKDKITLLMIVSITLLLCRLRTLPLPTESGNAVRAALIRYPDKLCNY